MDPIVNEADVQRAQAGAENLLRIVNTHQWVSF